MFSPEGWMGMDSPLNAEKPEKTLLRFSAVNQGDDDDDEEDEEEEEVCVEGPDERAEEEVEVETAAEAEAEDVKDGLETEASELPVCVGVSTEAGIACWVAAMFFFASTSRNPSF